MGLSHTFSHCLSPFVPVPIGSLTARLWWKAQNGADVRRRRSLHHIPIFTVSGWVERDVVWTAVWSIMLSEAPVDLYIINIPLLSDRTLTSQIRGSQIVTFKLSSPLLQMQSTHSPFLTSAVPEKKPSRSTSVCACVTGCLSLWLKSHSQRLCQIAPCSLLHSCDLQEEELLLIKSTACTSKITCSAHTPSSSPFPLSFTASFPLFLSLCLTNDEHQDEQCNSRWKALCERVVHFLEIYVD